MSVFVNFKICDNADECSGIEICPTNAIYWDGIKETVALDNEKCISCDSCVYACPAGAIRVAHNEEEAEKIQYDLDNDPRTRKDLLVERYGASPVDSSILISVKDAEEMIEKNISVLAIEIINNDDAPCLINSVPISEAFDLEKYEYYKVTISDASYLSFAKKYSIHTCPALLIFRNENLALYIEGIIENNDYFQRMKFVEKVNDAIQRIR